MASQRFTVLRNAQASAFKPFSRPTRQNGGGEWRQGAACRACLVNPSSRSAEAVVPPLIRSFSSAVLSVLKGSTSKRKPCPCSPEPAGAEGQRWAEPLGAAPRRPAPPLSAKPRSPWGAWRRGPYLPLWGLRPRHARATVLDLDSCTPLCPTNSHSANPSSPWGRGPSHEKCSVCCASRVKAESAPERCARPPCQV